MRHAIAAALLALVARPVWAEQAPATEAGGERITVLFTSDLRGRVVDPECGEGRGSAALLPHIAAAVEAERARASAQGAAAQPVLLDAGDALFPSPLIRDLAASPASARNLVAALRSAGYDALATGNTTLGAPLDAMRGLLSAAVSGDLPMIATNLECADAGDYSDEEEAEEACRQGLVDLTRRSALIERGGLRVGVFSVLPDDLGERLARGNMAGARLTDPLEASRSAVRELRAGGAGLVVLLSHLDRTETAPRLTLQLLARLAPEDQPDLVITANTANLAIQMSTSRAGPIVLAVSEDAIGRVALERREGRWRAAEVGEIGEAPEAGAPSADLLGRIVSSWNAIYCERQVRRVSGGELSGEMDRDDFMHLALRAMREQTRADIGVLNAGLVDDDDLFPLRGPLTQGQIRRALPYDNELRVATIRGSDLAGVAERLTGSGAAVLEGLEDDDGTIKVNGRDVDPDARYRLVTIDFVAEGGDGIVDPEAVTFETPGPGAGGSAMLADRIVGWLAERPGRGPYDPDSRLDLHRAPLWSGSALVDAAISDLQINNRAEGYAQPPLDRQELFNLTLAADFRGGMSTRDHRWDNTLRLRYGRQRLQTEVGGPEHEWAESDDIIQLRSIYTFDYIRNRLLDGAWYGPSIFATYQLESEFAHEGEGDHFLEMTGLLGLELNPLAWLKLAVGAGVRSTLLTDDSSPVPGLSFRGEVARRRFFGLPQAPIYLAALVDYFLLWPHDGPAHKLTIEGRVEVEIVGPLRLAGSLRLFLYDEANQPVATALDTTLGVTLALNRRLQTF